MDNLTTKEHSLLQDVLTGEETAHAKFSFYAGAASESAVKKLCAQLADRSREHFTTLLSQLEDRAGQSQSGKSQ